MKSLIINIFYKAVCSYNYINQLLFSLFFYPYYYRISHYGNIINWKYISNLDTDVPSNDIFITYECDDKYKMFNRIIHNQRFIGNTSIKINTSLPLNVEYTNYVFINIRINIFNTEFTIYLRSDEYNFYFVGNKIDCSFITYYFLNVLKPPPFAYFKRRMYDLLYIKNILRKFANAKTQLTYNLIIIDDKFKTISLNERDSITFNKTNYTVNKIT